MGNHIKSSIDLYDHTPKPPHILRPQLTPPSAKTIKHQAQDTIKSTKDFATSKVAFACTLKVDGRCLAYH